MFVKNYLISFMVLIGMYIALDMVFNFGNLNAIQGAIAHRVFDIPDHLRHLRFLFLPGVFLFRGSCRE